ncbi:MAG TPA: hypothetical protein VHL34_14935 [Rhizomicrobium sp.]|jgi:hypothetical protein|nr:hypothetical protein [Rhizomicrobium sp.]
MSAIHGSNLPTKWVWLICPTCNHSVAQTYGGAEQIGLEAWQQRGWCSICGKLGCLTHTPSHVSYALGDEKFDPDQSREAHLERLRAEGRLRYMVIDIQTFEVKYERLTVAQAIMKSIWLNGYHILLTSSWRSACLNIFRDRQRITSIEVNNAATISGEERWQRVFAQILTGQATFPSGYRAITDDFYRMALRPRSAA